VEDAGHAEEQALFRQVNQRIALVNSQWVGSNDDTPLEVLCECGDITCVSRVKLTTGEYDAIRSNPVLFVMLPGHEDEALERVKRGAEGYVVVANVGDAAQTHTATIGGESDGE
jgi:hypothetical protein